MTICGAIITFHMTTISVTLNLRLLFYNPITQCCSDDFIQFQEELCVNVKMFPLYRTYICASTVLEEINYHHL